LAGLLCALLPGEQTMIKEYWKEIAILGLCGVILSSHFGPLRPEPETVTRVQVQYRDRVQTVYKDKIVYREKVVIKPDGTRIEEKETSQTETREQEHTKEKNKKNVIVKKQPKPRFLLGVTYDIVNAQYTGQVGVRIADLPFHIIASLHGPRIGLGLGFSIEIP
jgi:hypothetical protein